MRNEVFAGIVLYNPDVSLLKQELEALNSIGVSVIVVDNNSFNKSELIGLLAFYVNNVEVIWNEENQGIAKAHNQIIESCKKKGVDWVITFDQDSVIPDNMLSEYAHYTKLENGIVSPTINYLNSNKKIQFIQSEYSEKDWVIASASMINVKAWMSVGGFDEKMFIDLVDRDFCIRIRKAGYKIIVLNNVILNHNLGNPVTKKFLFHSFTISNHSAIRKYYKVRNYIYLYKKDEVGLLDCLYHIIQIFIETLFLEKNKKKKIASLFQGIGDGIKLSTKNSNTK